MSHPIHLPSSDEIIAQLRPHKGLLAVLGIVQGVLGALAISVPQIATRIGVEFIGVLLLLAAVIYIIAAFRLRGWGGFILFLFLALLDVGMGWLILSYPANAAMALTLVLAAVLIAQGILRVILAFRSELRASRNWLLLGGLASGLLGGLLWAEWPADVPWAIGLLLGLNLIMAGAGLVALSFSLSNSGSSGEGTSA